MNGLAEWKLIVDGPGDPAWNMAVDEWLFQSVTSAGCIPTLRFYHWDGLAVSMGRFQSVERTIDTEQVGRLNIPLVRRITGGRGILHGDDLTLSVACRSSHLGLRMQGSIQAVYTRLTGILADALTVVDVHTRQGTDVRFDTREPMMRRFNGPTGSMRNAGDCFTTVSSSDLIHVTSGTKVMGGALHRQGDVFLFQASIPLHSNPMQTQAPSSLEAPSVFRGPNSSGAPHPYVGIDAPQLRVAICSSFCDFGGDRLSTYQLGEHELAQVELLADQRYRDRNWTWNTARSE